MFNNCMASKQIPVEWRRVKVIAIPKPENDPDSPKSYRPISLLSITFKLYECLPLHRFSPSIDPKPTLDQAGFRPGQSCADQLLNLIQNIKDGYQNRRTTGCVFVDLSATYSTVQHWLMIHMLHTLIGGSHMCHVVQSLLTNRRYFVSLNGMSSRWRPQRNGLSQGSIMAPLLFNIYTNDQSLTKKVWTIFICGCPVPYHPGQRFSLHQSNTGGSLESKCQTTTLPTNRDPIQPRHK